LQKERRVPFSAVYSQCLSCPEPVRNRGKHTYEAIIFSVSTEQLNKELQGKIIKDSVLCSDGFRPYIKFAQGNDLIHKRLNVAAGVQVIEKVFHIQNVNA
jgi:hypothetical protein